MELMKPIGIVLVISGTIVFTIIQVLLFRWIKKYNKEWMSEDEVS